MDFYNFWGALMGTSATAFSFFAFRLALKERKERLERMKPVITNFEALHKANNQIICRIRVQPGDVYCALTHLEFSGQRIAWAVQVGPRLPNDVWRQSSFVDSLPLNVALLRTDPYKDLFVYLEQAPSAGFDVRLMTSVGEVFFDVPDELAASMREGAESTNQ